MSDPELVVGFDPLSPKTLADPYPFYRALRDHAPVVEIPGAGYTVVSRYADVSEATLVTEDLSSKLVAIFLASGDGTTTIDAALGDGGGGDSKAPVDVLAIADPPDHTRQRRIAQTVLSARMFRRLEEGVRVFVAELIDELTERGTADWMRDLAFRVPMSVALDLVGFPRDDWQRVKEWCDHGVALLSGVNTPEELLEHGRHTAELYDYVCMKLDEAEATPRDDLTETLLDAVHQGTLTRAEAGSIVLQILIAGNDSSASTMGSGVRLLADDRGLQAALRETPSRIPDFIEETLRLESPFQGHFRLAKRDAEIGGFEVSKGSRVFLLWGSANRDERVFDSPDEVDLDRPNLKSHLAFGHGIHHCLGAPLARLEVRVVLEELLSRTSSFERAELGPLDYLPSAFVRTLRSLPLELRRGRSS